MTEQNQNLTSNTTVWRVDLDTLSNSGLRAGAECLDEEERARWARFRGDHVKRRFVAAHIALRNILGASIGVSPDRVQLSRTELGRPILPNGEISFSLSHSAGIAFIATGLQKELGMDVEIRRDLPDLDALIELACSPGERAQLDQLSDKSLRLQRFFEVWVIKEALLKAVGVGLRRSLRAVDTLEGAWIRPDPEGAPELRLHAALLDIEGGYAAVAAGGVAPVIRVRPFDWDEAGLERIRGESECCSSS